MDRFGPLLQSAITARGLTQKQFAELVGVTPSMVNKVIKAQRAPAWQRSSDWAKALGLIGREADRFEDAMHLAAAPPRARLVVRRLEAQLHASRRR